MYDKSKEIDIPIEERLMIFPKQRQQLFLNLVENYKIFCPNIKMIYAALNFDSALKIDYLVIFESERKGKSFILWDSPFTYTNRSVPSYRYVVKNNLHNDFFETCKSHFCQMDRDKFFDFLRSDLGGNLSSNPEDPSYWKSPTNAHILMKGMSEMGLLYIPEGFRNTGRRKVD